MRRRRKQVREVMVRVHCYRTNGEIVTTTLRSSEVSDTPKDDAEFPWNEVSSR